MDFESKFANLKISTEKKTETRKNHKIMDNLQKIFQYTADTNKLYYILATHMKPSSPIEPIVKGIEGHKITNEKMIRGALDMLEQGKPISEFYALMHFDDFDAFVSEHRHLGRKELMRRINAHERFRYIDGTRLADVCKSIEAGDRERKDIYSEGLLAFMHKPGENAQLSEEIRQQHLRRTGGRVVTRFPPEPNGYLHIGHAKALNLDFGYAEKFGGITYLRFDDTNPRNEKPEFYEKIIDDVRWLGFKPAQITAASDHFDKLIELAFVLIDKGLAYCCHQSKEEMQEFRKNRMPSPWRDRAPEVNRALFQEMIDGLWPEKSICLRLKMDHTSKNPLMHDLVAYRVIKMQHLRAKKFYNVYPSYDYTHCINDSLEDVTHSFCSREFYSRRESYYWVVDNLELYRPTQWEFSRLNVSNTVLSKRKLTRLVEEGIVEGWDDPRLYTIAGLRRRGFPPRAINRFAQSVGITCSESIIDVKILENFVREELDSSARRIMAVRRPLKLIIENFDGPHEIEIEDIPGAKVETARRKLKVSNVVYIDESDFSECDKDGFMRLTPNQPVGLYRLFAVRFKERRGDAVVVTVDRSKPQKYIQWVSEPVRVVMKMYEPLFNSFNPEEVDMMSDINRNSLKVVEGFADRRIEGCRVGDVFQFQRIGYFCVDRVDAEVVTLNLTIGLRNF